MSEVDEASEVDGVGDDDNDDGMMTCYFGYLKE